MSLVTTKEAAQILGVTPVRMRQLIKEKRLAAEKHGRDHLLQDREVERQVRSPKSSQRTLKFFNCSTGGSSLATEVVCGLERDKAPMFS